MLTKTLQSLLVLGWAAGVMFSAHAATYEVRELGDRGEGTLRWAIEQANQNPGEDSIEFSVRGQIRLGGGLPPLVGDTVLAGPGREWLEVSGERRGRVLKIGEGARVAVMDLALSNGSLGGGEHGAGIWNQGTLTLSNCVVAANQTVAGFGGGIFNQGTLRIVECLFSGNTVTGGVGREGAGGRLGSPDGFGGGAGGGGGGLGGAIYSEAGPVEIQRSLFRENGAIGGDGGGGGGATSDGAAGGGPNGGLGVVGETIPSGSGRGGGGGGGGRLGSNPFETGRSGGFGGGGGGAALPDGSPPLASGGTSEFGGGQGGAGRGLGRVISAGGGGGGAGMGGAFFLETGWASILACEFENNRAVGGHGGVTALPGAGGDGYGGAIFLDRGAAEIEASVFRENRAMGAQEGIGGNGGGGAIFVHLATNLVSRSTFQWNLAAGGGSVEALSFGAGSAQGGGAMVMGGSAKWVNCTLSQNIAQGGSAGLPYFSGTGGQAYGGGLRASGGRVEMVHCTLTGNSAVGGSQGGGDVIQIQPERLAESLGGGFASFSGALILRNCIVARNTVTHLGTQSDGDGVVQSRGGNWVQVTGGITGLTAADSVGLDPKLGPLAENGGPTQTHTLLEGSPAKDAVASDPEVLMDQRGFRRPEGERSDAGSVEVGRLAAGSIEILVAGNAMARGSTVTVAPEEELVFRTSYPQGTVLFTVDGSAPTAESEWYRGPIRIVSNLTVRALAYRRDFGESVEAGPVHLTVSGVRRPVLNLSTAGQGRVGVEPRKGPYVLGQVVLLHAMPAYGWRLKGWSGDHSGSDETTEVRLDSDKHIMAEFEWVRPLRITATTKGRGRVLLSPPGGLYESNTVVRISAVPELVPGDQSVGYPIQWTGDVTGVGYDAWVRVNRDLRFEVEFIQTGRSPNFFQLHTDVRGMGRIYEPAKYLLNPSGYAEGMRVPVQAKAEPGWEFLHWTGALMGTNDLDRFGIVRDASVTAVFGTHVSVVIAGQGTVDMGAGGNRAVGWDLKRFTAIPAEGHYFVRWGDGGYGDQNPLEWRAREANPTIAALFAPLQVGEVSLVKRVKGQGFVSSEPPGNRHPRGRTLRLYAIPVLGQRFLGWSGALEGMMNPVEIRMDGPQDVLAEFTDLPSVSMADPFRFRSDGSYSLRIEGAAGRTYRVERSSDLMTWAVEKHVTGDSRWIQVPLSKGSGVTRGFFRVSDVSP